MLPIYIHFKLNSWYPIFQNAYFANTIEYLRGFLSIRVCKTKSVKTRRFWWILLLFSIVFQSFTNSSVEYCNIRLKRFSGEKDSLHLHSFERKYNSSNDGDYFTRKLLLSWFVMHSNIFWQKTFIVYADGELILKLKCSNLFSKKPNLISMENKIIELPLAPQS